MTVFSVNKSLESNMYLPEGYSIGFKLQQWKRIHVDVGRERQYRLCRNISIDSWRSSIPASHKANGEAFYYGISEYIFSQAFVRRIISAREL